MSDVTLKVENLSKRYLVGGRKEAETLKETLGRISLNPFRKKKDAESDKHYIWPLKDLSFEVKKGEIVGLLGKNGSGKTTLLKILSQVVEPTSGQATIWGKVGALLGAGTAFNRDLTGHENIYLRGAILGISHKQVSEKYEEIVNFSDIREFLTTPVKHYSKGMVARLAFSVDMYLEPEVMLLDELLAVGDQAFLQKSKKQMMNLMGTDRTVLFVSHDMDAIRDTCNRCIWLKDGNIVADGPVDKVTVDYEDFMLKYGN